MKAPPGGSASKACGDQAAAAAAAAAAAGKQFIQVGLPAIVYENFNCHKRHRRVVYRNKPTAAAAAITERQMSECRASSVSTSKANKAPRGGSASRARGSSSSSSSSGASVTVLKTKLQVTSLPSSTFVAGVLRTSTSILWVNSYNTLRSWCTAYLSHEQLLLLQAPVMQDHAHRYNVITGEGAAVKEVNILHLHGTTNHKEAGTAS
jgi:hypothetical protein